IATLIHQRRLTPSCGGRAPTAERTVGLAGMIAESLTLKPGIREYHRNSRSRRFGSSKADVHKPRLPGGSRLRAALSFLLAFGSPPFTLISQKPICRELSNGIGGDDERRAGDRRIGLYRQLLHLTTARGGPSGPHHSA